MNATVQKAIVPLAMKNGFAEAIESARVVRFLLDDQRKNVVQANRWVFGGSPSKPGLASGGTNRLTFVIASPTPLPHELNHNNRIILIVPGGFGEPSSP